MRLSDGSVAEVRCFTALALHLAIFGKACFVLYTLGSLLSAFQVLLVGLWAALVGYWWRSAFGGIACNGGVRRGMRVHWLALWVSFSPTLLLVQLMILVCVALVMVVPAVRAFGVASSVALSLVWVCCSLL